jgi:hypothetical protein
LQHLRSAPDQNLDAVFQLSRATVPPAIFQQVLAALSHPGVTHFPAEAIKQAALKLVASLVPAVTAGEVDWEEVPGWLTFGDHRGARSRFAFGGYRADTFPQVIATWHEYHVAAGRKAPHAALLWAAGYTVTEALTLVAAGELPDRETLETMSALHGSSDDYTNIFAEEH